MTVFEIGKDYDGIFNVAGFKKAGHRSTVIGHRNISPKPNNSDKIPNFAVRLYYQLSYNYSAQYNMLLINALGIH